MPLCALFLNSGKQIAVGCMDCNIYVYATTGKFLTSLAAHSASVCTMANFGDFFASGGDHGCCSLVLWDSKQLKKRNKQKLHGAALTCIVDLMDGFHLATAGYDKKIVIYNYRKG